MAAFGNDRWLIPDPCGYMESEQSKKRQMQTFHGGNFQCLSVEALRVGTR